VAVAGASVVVVDPVVGSIGIAVASVLVESVVGSIGVAVAGTSLSVVVTEDPVARFVQSRMAMDAGGTPVP